MSLALRLGIGLLVMGSVLAALNVFVFRRTAVAFALSPRTRRLVAAAVAVPFALTLFFRALGSWLPLGFGEPVAVAASVTEMAIVLASVVLGAAALAARLTRGGRATWRRLSARSKAHLAAEPATEGLATSAAASDITTSDTTDALALPARPRREATAALTTEAMSTAGAASETGGAIDLPARPRRDDATTHPARDDRTSPRGDRTAPRAEWPPVVSRRLFVEQAVAGSALVVGGASAGYGALFGRHDYELSTVPVPIPGLSRAADGFTIVQLSDIHLGQFVGETEMRAAEELVRKAKGDLVVLTGDLIDHDPRYAERLGRLVRRLSSIRPVVAIPGNHDYYTGVGVVLETLRQAGATVLVNQATTMLGERGGFVLAGLDDRWGEAQGGGPNLGRALADVRSEAPRIVLCHNPKHFLETAGEIALQISGHTHGGQVNLGVNPASLALQHGYIAGLYENRGSRLYVNRGFGTAGPAMRVGAPPEVTRIVLVSA